MSRTKLNAYQQQMGQMLNNTPGAADRYAMQKWGMSYADFDQSIRVISEIANGRMPDGASMRWLNEQAAAKYGWGPQRVRSELQQAISAPNPQSRIFGYLSAGGNQVTEQIFSDVLEAVQTAQSSMLQRGLEERMTERDSQIKGEKVDRSEWANGRAAQHAKDQQQLRGAIASHFNLPHEGETYGQRHARVQKAREQLADRIEAQQGRDYVDRINGREPAERSLRDQLAEGYDMAKVRAASIEYGFGDFEQQADRVVSEVSHLEDGADITEQLRDI